MTRTTDITSFSDLRKNLRRKLDGVKESGRPLFITTNGQAEAVVLSPRAYDELADRADLPEIIAMIERCERDSVAGRVIEAEDALARIGAKYGVGHGRKTDR